MTVYHLVKAKCEKGAPVSSFSSTELKSLSYYALCLMTRYDFLIILYCSKTKTLLKYDASCEVTGLFCKMLNCSLYLKQLFHELQKTKLLVQWDVDVENIQISIQ